jgi:hypothetical protein
MYLHFCFLRDIIDKSNPSLWMTRPTFLVLASSTVIHTIAQNPASSENTRRALSLLMLDLELTGSNYITKPQLFITLALFVD